MNSFRRLTPLTRQFDSEYSVACHWLETRSWGSVGFQNACNRRTLNSPSFIDIHLNSFQLLKLLLKLTPCATCKELSVPFFNAMPSRLGP